MPSAEKGDKLESLVGQIESSEIYLSQKESGQIRVKLGWPTAFTEDEDLTLQWLNHHLWRATQERDMAQILADMLRIQMQYFTKEELVGVSPLTVSEVVEVLSQAVPPKTSDGHGARTWVCRDYCFVCFPESCQYLMLPEWIPLPGEWRSDSRRDPTKTYMSAVLKDLTPVKRLLGQ